MSDILIPNPEKLEALVQKIAHDGKEHFHVIADFDRTLTSAFTEGRARYSLEAIFEEECHLGPEAAQKSQENFDKYHPIEIDPTVSLEDKRTAMHERRTKQFAVMLKAGIKKSIIKHAMKSEKIAFREGDKIFFKLLNDNKIPLLIFSASGLGYEGIHACLEHHNNQHINIEIIANNFLRDENGKAIAIKEPIIHSFNKGEMVVHELPIYGKIKDRKNIILLGDAIGDTHMADGFDYKNIIKIGFLNNDTPANREQFQTRYDLVILNDGPMNEVNKVLQKILIETQ